MNNWIEELYQITEKDPYSQYGESIYLAHILSHVGTNKYFVDIGCADDHLSNSKFFRDMGWNGLLLDKINGQFLTVENIMDYVHYGLEPDFLSIDIDGNDYWILRKMLENKVRPKVIIAEFNAAFTDSRAIKYDPEFVWGEDNYYGFTFLAGVELAREFGYKVIFQNDNLNMYFVHKDYVKVPIPPLAFNKIDFFPHSDKQWIIFTPRS